MLRGGLKHSRTESSSVVKKSVTARVFFSSQKISDPLRILFCGSDDFSIASLRAVYKEHQQNPSSVASIDVVCRPGKRVGRGFKTIREVPIAKVARSLSLPLHEIDTFTGWRPPVAVPSGDPINLVIAVSFGRLVPSRILDGAKYAGLNVHPSMLPDFHGPAPLHHTLLSNCARTGVTLQTMHHEHFDQGRILDQTPFPGLEHDCATVPELSSKMAPLGAEMLVEAIRNRTFVPPHDENRGWSQSGSHSGLDRYARKITTTDSHIDWSDWTAEEILRKQTIIGPLWNTFHQFNTRTKEQKPRRIIWSSGLSKAPVSNLDTTLNPGNPYCAKGGPQFGNLYINTSDGHVLQAEKVKLDGEREKNAGAALLATTLEAEKLASDPETIKINANEIFLE